MNSIPAAMAANFDLVWVAEKEERKRKKRRKKEEKKRKKGDFPIGLVIQRYSSLSVFWVRPGQFSRPFIVSFMRMSHPVRKKKVQNCTEWTIYRYRVHLTTIMLSILANILDLKSPRFSSKYNEYSTSTTDES